MEQDSPYPLRPRVKQPIISELAMELSRANQRIEELEAKLKQLLSQLNRVETENADLKSVVESLRDGTNYGAP